MYKLLYLHSLTQLYMNYTPKLPVFIFAFANDINLPSLKQEQKEIKELSYKVEKYFEVNIIYNVSIKDLQKAFLRHGTSIIAFHYSGHASASSLLLNSENSSDSNFDALSATKLIPSFSSYQYRAS